MDAEYAALASAAAMSLITSMTKDGWEGIKATIARLWRREPADRQVHIEAALEQSRQELVSTEEPLAEATQAELVAEWKAKFRRLLSAYPELAKELADALGIGQPHAGGVRFGPVHHLGVGDVNQAARDITVNRGRLDD